MPLGTTVYVNVAIGSGYVCGIKAAGNFDCWSPDPNTFRIQHQLDLVADCEFDDIVFGAAFGCGLQHDGTVLCWDNPLGIRYDTPGGRFVQIARRTTACAVCKPTAASPAGVTSSMRPLLRRASGAAASRSTTTSRPIPRSSECTTPPEGAGRKPTRPSRSRRRAPTEGPRWCLRTRSIRGETSTRARR